MFSQRRQTSGQQTPKGKEGWPTSRLGETRIRTTRRPLPPVRVAGVKATRNTRRRGCRQTGALVRCRWECRLVQPRGETVRRFFTNLQRELPVISDSLFTQGSEDPNSGGHTHPPCRSQQPAAGGRPAVPPRAQAGTDCGSGTLWCVSPCGADASPRLDSGSWSPAEAPPNRRRAQCVCQRSVRSLRPRLTTFATATWFLACATLRRRGAPRRWVGSLRAEL